VVQMEGVHLMKYLPIIRNSPAPPHVVVDWHNIESEIMSRFANRTHNWGRRMAARRTAKQIERAEDRLLDSCALHTVTSERERQKLLARRPRANVHVIANGVDTHHYEPVRMAEANHQDGRGCLKNTILFVGYMDYHANADAVTWFCREVWPGVARNHPDLQFVIVGRDPAPEVWALQSDRILVTGTVDDVRPFYESAVAAVVPLRMGSGTRLKILEAMAAGVPVVSTRVGAEGIDAEDNVHLLLAESAADFSTAIARLTTSKETRDGLTTAARSLVTRRYDWSVIGEQLYRLHAGLAQGLRIAS
jgi:polysaccharide biosynthesis protein PslH